MPPESLDQVAGPGEILEVQGAEQLDTGHRNILAVEGAEEAESSTQTDIHTRNMIKFLTSSICHKYVRYAGYWVMSFSGFAVIIAGMTSRHETGWGLASIVSYTCWTAAVSLCLYLDLKLGDIVKHVASHVACCAGTLYFFVGALQISSTDLPMYIPIGVNLGLLLSFGLQHMSLPTKLQIMSYLGFGYNYEVIQRQQQQQPILPLVELRPR